MGVAERISSVQAAQWAQRLLTSSNPIAFDLALSALRLGVSDEPESDGEALGSEEAAVLGVGELPDLAQQRRRERRVLEEGDSFIAGCRVV